jgi:peptidoglycan/LPS O-acetylase OafA/YrhL
MRVRLEKMTEATQAAMQERPVGRAYEPLLRPVMPELDTLRGVAILGVLFLHGFFWPYSRLHFGPWATLWLNITQPGWLGVNLFFVLSGFLITGILIDSAARPDYYRRFYTRRALRILPAYYGLLIVLWFLGQARGAYIGLGFLYLANVTEFFGVGQAYGPLWSLAVEEHFYLLWPTAVRRLSLPRVGRLAGAIVVGVSILRAVGFLLGDTAGLSSYTWYVADGLACGALIAVLLRYPVSRQRVTRVAVGLILGTIVLGGLGMPFGILTRNRLLGAALQYTAISVLFSGVLLLLLVLGTGPYARITHNKTLRFFGYISYGLYLVHLMVFRLYDQFCHRFNPALLPRDNRLDLVFVRFVVAGGAAVLLAYVSRIYYENWFLRIKDRMAAKKDEADRGLAILEG